MLEMRMMLRHACGESPFVTHLARGSWEKNMADHVLQIRTGGKVHNYVSRALELLPVCANIRSCAHH